MAGRLRVRLALPIGKFSEIYFSAGNVRTARGWFTAIEWGHGPLDLGLIPARAARSDRLIVLSKL